MDRRTQYFRRFYYFRRWYGSDYHRPRVPLPSHLVGDNSKSNRIIQSPEASVPASIILHDTLSHSKPARTLDRRFIYVSLQDENTGVDTSVQIGRGRRLGRVLVFKGEMLNVDRTCNWLSWFVGSLIGRL